MLQVKINHELGQLTNALQSYQTVQSKRTSLESLAKNMTKLAFFVREELLKTQPPAQEIADISAIVQKTGGYKIRKSIMASVLKRVDKRTKKGKLTKSSLDIYGAYDLAVKKEVKARQNAIGFLGRSALMSHSSPLITRARSRKGQELSRGETKLNGQDAETTLRWSNQISYMSNLAAEGITAKGQNAILTALRRTVADIQLYIERKQREAIGKALGGKK